jgi:hypothetical protein
MDILFVRRGTPWRAAVLSGVVSGAAIVATAAAAQPVPAAPPAGRQATSAARLAQPLGPADAPVILLDDRDARETREAFNELLRKHPPALGRVLKLDPALLSNPEYLTAYPGLAGFLAQHPEVARSPAFFLADVRIEADEARRPDSAALEVFTRILDAISVLVVMLVLIGTGLWLIRTLIDYRRWSRLSRVQADVHGKLLDRLSNNDDLVAYMQTDAGRRFLESAPIPLEAEPARALGAPYGRILWSLQAGVVVLALGLGLRFVGRSVPADVAWSLATIGALAVAVGLGFVASAVLSYLLSQRLGLLTPPGERPPAPADRGGAA